MSSPPKVLLVDDQLRDIRPLIDLIESLGYSIDHFADEEAARGALEAVHRGREAYALALIDVMISTKDIMKLVELDAAFFEDSQNTGIRLCDYARRELGISFGQLPIVCISGRNDDEVKNALAALGIPLFSRVPMPGDESIVDCLRVKLPRIPMLGSNLNYQFAK